VHSPPVALCGCVCLADLPLTEQGTNKGLAKSTDAGATWISAGFNSQHIDAIAIDPEQP